MTVATFPISFKSLQSPEFMAFIWQTLNQPACQIAMFAMILHVANYNLTARIEHRTRCFTKLLGVNAVYFYAVYLVLSALVRDHFIHTAVAADAGSFILFSETVATILGAGCFVTGFLLNLWTLSALGIKGMYNGDSFGFLFDAPVTNGPYKIFNDPQYVGTTLSLVGTAIYYQSLAAYLLAVDMYVIFWCSVTFFEGPHMNRIYAHKNKKD